MANETVRAKTTISAPAEVVFAVLADPTTHAAIDGTGWVREAVDPQPLSKAGQIFRMNMYHERHPDRDYVMANRINDFEPANVISWEPGQVSDGAPERFGGWIWRYDLNEISPSETEVTLSYDWSAVRPEIREYLTFPPFGMDHLHNSLSHLAGLATSVG